MPIGCGAAGCLTLVMIFGLGFYLLKGGASRLIGYYFTLVEREIDRNSDPAVTPEQRAHLKEELRRFRANLGKDNNATVEAQTIVLDLNRAVRDQRLTPDEIENLTRSLRQANERLERKPEVRNQKPEEISNVTFQACLTV